MSGPAGPDMMEPAGHLGLRSNCDGTCFGWPCDDEIERMRSEFALAADVETKKALAEAIQLRAVETVPYWPAAQLYLVRGVRSNVDGILNAAIPVY
jgi:peptide/nickel transport system substrate-binding protein